MLKALRDEQSCVAALGKLGEYKGIFGRELQIN